MKWYFYIKSYGISMFAWPRGCIDSNHREDLSLRSLHLSFELGPGPEPEPEPVLLELGPELEFGP